MSEITKLTREEQIEQNISDLLHNTSFEDYDWGTCEDFTELYESLEQQITEDEVIYYSTAMNYLMENDCSLNESMALAHDMGYTCDNINSELLATLLQQGNLMTELSELSNDLEECFDVEEDEDEDEDEV